MINKPSNLDRGYDRDSNVQALLESEDSTLICGMPRLNGNFKATKHQQSQAVVLSFEIRDLFPAADNPTQTPNRSIDVFMIV